MSTKTNTSNTSLDLIKSIQDTSRTASLYGKLLELKDMKLHIINRKLTQKNKSRRVKMSNLANINLEENLFEQYKEDLEKKYFGGINKELGEPWFKKTDSQIEAEAEKLVKEFMDRNS